MVVTAIQLDLPRINKMSEKMTVSVGSTIKAWREYRGLKPARLAESAGLSRAYLSQLEHNKIAHPSDQQLSKLAQALDISLTTIIRRHLPDELKITTERQRTLDADVSPIYPHRLKTGALGDHIEHLISRARISEQEKQIVAERIARVTHEMVDLVEATHSLKKVGNYQPVEEILRTGT